METPETDTSMLPLVTFRKGDTVFSIDGQEAVYVAESDFGGHVVIPGYTSGAPDDPGFYTDGSSAAVWHEVYLEPPKAKLNAEVQALVQKRDALREEVDELKSERLRASENRAEQLARLKRYRALDRIDEFLQGKITHALLYNDSGQIAVKTIEEATKSNDGNYSKDRRLVTLYGRTGGDFEWGINTYSDGSGRSEDKALFFLDEASAIAAGREMVRDQMARLLAEKPPRDYYLEQAMESAKRLGEPVLEQIVARVYAYRVAAKQKEFDEAQKRLDLAGAALLLVKNGGVGA